MWRANLNSSGTIDELESGGGFYLDESDIINEIDLDDEDLPDATSDDESIDYGDSGGSNSFDSDMDVADDAVQVFTRHAGEVYAVACSPTDNKLVATGSGDGKGFLWRVGQGHGEIMLGGHEETVSRLAFSSSGKLLATADLNGVLQIWDAFGHHKHTLGESEGGGEINKRGGEVEWLKWHPREHVLLTCSDDGSSRIWDVDRGHARKLFYGHGKSVTCGDFTPNGEIVCTGSLDGTLRTWNLASCNSVNVVGLNGYAHDTPSSLLCLAIDSNSVRVLTGVEDGSVYVVNIITGKVVGSLGAHEGPVQDIKLSPSLPWVATGGSDGKLIIWDLEHSTTRSTCEHKMLDSPKTILGGVTCLSWLGESRYVATGCEDGKIRIWDARSDSLVRIFSGHSGEVQSLSVTSNLDFVVSASADGTVRVFDVAGFK